MAWYCGEPYISGGVLNCGLFRAKNKVVGTEVLELLEKCKQNPRRIFQYFYSYTSRLDEELLEHYEGKGCPLLSRMRFVAIVWEGREARSYSRSFFYVNENNLDHTIGNLNLLYHKEEFPKGEREAFFYLIIRSDCDLSDVLYGLNLLNIEERKTN